MKDFPYATARVDLLAVLHFFAEIFGHLEPESAEQARFHRSMIYSEDVNTSLSWSLKLVKLYTHPVAVMVAEVLERAIELFEEEDESEHSRIFGHAMERMIWMMTGKVMHAGDIRP